MGKRKKTTEEVSLKEKELRFKQIEKIPNPENRIFLGNPTNDYLLC